MRTKPLIEVSGVRSSWEIEVMKSDFMRLTASACSLARISVDSASLRWVMSRKMCMTCHLPRMRTWESDNSTGKVEPSLRTATISRVLPWAMRSCTAWKMDAELSSCGAKSRGSLQFKASAEV